MNEKLYPSDLTDEEWDSIQRAHTRCQTGWTTTRTLYAASFERHLLCDERRDSMANVAARVSKVEERLSLLSTMASEWGMGADSRPLASQGAWTRRQTQAPDRRVYG